MPTFFISLRTRISRRNGLGMVAWFHRRDIPDLMLLRHGFADAEATPYGIPDYVGIGSTLL